MKSMTLEIIGDIQAGGEVRVRLVYENSAPMPEGENDIDQHIVMGGNFIIGGNTGNELVAYSNGPFGRI